jgi:hypothetical protein
MENKGTKWLLAIAALALLINAAVNAVVNYRPYQLVVVAVAGSEGHEPSTESYRLNVYTGRVSVVMYDDEESLKFYPEQMKKQFPKH